MSQTLEQLRLPSEFSEETLYVKRLKETMAAMPDPKGNRLCTTFKLDRTRHGALLAACARHGITITDLLTLHIDQILPVLQRAKYVDVPAYKRDHRTTPRRRER